MDIKAFIQDYFLKKEPLIVIDIGSKSIKLLEADLSEGVPRLVNLALVELKKEIFINNQIKNTNLVAERIAKLLEVNEIEGKRVVTVIPGPAAFIKKISLKNQPPKDLDSAVVFEAGSMIPYNMDDVKIDYHVLGKTGKSGKKIEVLVTVVKLSLIHI